jgi:nucleoside 2-deoxyribosyltransferase
MSFDAVAVRVMIASPSDVEEACLAAEKAIHDWNRSHSENRRVVFIPWRWKEDAKPSLSAPAQSIINAQGVDKSDLIIAIFGSRLGAPTAAGASGTVEEIELALAQGKQVSLFFSDQPRPVDIDPDQLKSLLEFKGAVEGLAGSFSSADDLRRKIESTLSFYDLDAAANKRSDYFNTGVSDRAYEEVGYAWSYRPNPTNPDVWDAKTEQVRKIIARDRRGLGSFTIHFERDDDRSAPLFGIDGHPAFELDASSSRSSPGSMKLLKAHRKSGTSYAQDIQFSPQLSEGDRAHLIYRGSLPGYRFAHRDGIVVATLDTPSGVRDWDYSSYTVEHPVGLLTYSVFLADSLGATPLGPRVDHAGVTDNELTSEVTKNGYTQEYVERDGEMGVEMKLTVREPALGCEYLLRWGPPSKSE